ncbi:MAG: hypothetical protein RDU20_21280 [Desulfomonilaceae bacterium]|nr:hypothetical protein [Desulfomonilaceae bacterium]
MDEKSNYIGEMKAGIDELLHRVNEFQQCGRDIPKEDREKWRQAMADLDRKKAAVSFRLAELYAQSPDSWKHLKGGLEMAVAILADSFRRNASRFGRCFR